MALQASRRLARTINKHLVSRKHGYVSLAAQTYIYLLDRLRPSDSSLLAKELILEHVVSTLAANFTGKYYLCCRTSLEMRAFGQKHVTCF